MIFRSPNFSLIYEILCFYNIKTNTVFNFSRDMPDSVAEDADEGDLEMPKVYEPVNTQKFLD
jgi:hypothetical protein